VTAVTQQIKPDVYPRVDDEATIVLTYPHAQAIIQASGNWPFSEKIWECTDRELCHHRRRDTVRVRFPKNRRYRTDAKPLEKRRKIPFPICERCFWAA